MNIYDLPIPNFRELEDEAALKLILEVRSRRRVQTVSRVRNEKISKARPKVFDTPFGKFTAEQMGELLAKLKGG